MELFLVGDVPSLLELAAFLKIVYLLQIVIFLYSLLLQSACFSASNCQFVSCEMALSRCSFGPIVGTECSDDLRDAKRSFDIIPLTECKKEISSHKSTWAFSGVESEEDLILARAGIFYPTSKDQRHLNICPYHHSELGIGWRRGKDICKIPLELATHTNVRKGERGIGRETSKIIFQKTGLLVPVGSGNLLYTFVEI